MLWNSITLFKTIHTKYYDFYTYEAKLFFLSSGSVFVIVVVIIIRLFARNKERRKTTNFYSNK